jgi:hypothetical protein
VRFRNGGRDKASLDSTCIDCTLQVLLQGQRLKVAAELPEVPTLVDELMNFRMKAAPQSTDPLAAWREGPQG